MSSEISFVGSSRRTVSINPLEMVRIDSRIGQCQLNWCSMCSVSFLCLCGIGLVKVSSRCADYA